MRDKRKKKHSRDAKRDEKERHCRGAEREEKESV